MSVIERIRELLSATQLVRRCAEGDLSLEEFRRYYGSFYYEAALDGHEEGSGQFLQEHATAVELHRQIQEDVLDRLYLGSAGDRAAYAAAGRINADEATGLIRRIAQESNIGRVIIALQVELRNAGVP